MRAPRGRRQPLVYPAILAAGLVALTVAFVLTGHRPGDFQSTNGVAVTRNGTAYVLTGFPFAQIRRFGPTGQAEGSIGPGLGSTQLVQPFGITVGPNGLIYVSDQSPGRILVLTTAGRLVRVFGDHGPPAVRLSQPTGIMFGPDGLLYVADSGTCRVTVYRPSGALVRAFGHCGAGRGGLIAPEGLAVDAAHVYLAPKFPADALTIVAGTGSPVAVVTIPGGPVRNAPLALGPGRTLLLGDPDHRRVIRLTRGGRLVGGFGTPGGATGIAVGPNGTIDVAQGQAGFWAYTPSGRPLFQFGLGRARHPARPAPQPLG